MKTIANNYLEQLACINPDKPVEIYRNLHKKCYSVRQNGVVRFYTTNITLKKVKFVVREKGRQKVLRERQKNIHAFVKGFIVDRNDLEIGDTIYYNPYTYEKFMHRDSPIEFYNYEMLWNMVVTEMKELP